MVQHHANRFWWISPCRAAMPNQDRMFTGSRGTKTGWVDRSV